MEFWQVCPFFRSIFRHEKKVLALVLAFACAFTMFAGAAFTDEADINADNRDAVELLTALNIIQGYEDGSFDPEGTVDRAEMAKMIYVIRNGGNDDASAYETVTTSFTDISGHWAEGYIKYLQNTGIVAGKSATKFDPDSQVTTGEAMKMALALAGYDEEHAGLTGINWLNNTVSQATTVGMTDDVHSAIAGGCTRQDAAQILSNTLVNTGAVRWSAVVEGFVPDSETGLAYGGRWISGGEKWMDLSVETGFITAAPSSKTNPKGITFVWDENDDGVYGNSSRSNTESVTFRNSTLDVSDLFGYEVKAVWNSDDVSAADAVYGFYKTSNNVSYEMTWQDVEKDGDQVKFDGKSYDLTSTPIENKSIADSITAYADEMIYDGTDNARWTSNNFTNTDLADTVVFIDNNNDGDLDAVQVKTQTVAEIVYVGSNRLSTSTLVGGQDFYGFDYDRTPDLEDVAVYDDVARDDFAIVTYDYYNDKVTYEKADVQTATVEATRTVNDTVEIRMNGEWYKATEGYELPTTFVTGDSVEYVAIGNLIFDIDKTDGTWGSNSIAMIYRVTTGRGLDSGNIMASVITRSGDKMNVTVDKLDNVDVTSEAQLYDVLGQAVTYRVVNGDYEFRTLSDDNTAGYSDYDVSSNAYRYDSDASEYNNVDIHDRAVAFVYDNNGTPGDYDDNDADVLTGAELKRASATFSLVGAEDPYLTAKDAGFNYVFCMSVAADLDDLTTVGGNFGYLLSDAWETTVDGTYYRVFNLWTENGQKTAYEETGDTYKYPSGTVIRYELLSTDGDNIYIRSVEDADPIQGKVEARDGNFVGIDGNKLELVNDSVVMNVDTVKKEGISYGDEARADIPLADTTAAGKVNALYLEANDEIVFLLIDTANIEIVDNFDLRNPDATALRDALEAADEDNETVTVEGSIPAGTFTVPAGVTLVLNDGATVNRNTTLNGAGTVSVKGIVNIVDGSLTVDPDTVVYDNGAGFDVVGGKGLTLGTTNVTVALGTGDYQVTHNAEGGTDYVIKTTSELGADLTVSGEDTLTVATGATLTTGTNTLAIGNTATIDGTVDVSASGTLVLRQAGRVTINGSLTNTGTGIVTIENGARVMLTDSAVSWGALTGSGLNTRNEWYQFDGASTWTSVA